jgi:DNA ligase-associated metallophosphoesterase
MTIQFLGQTLSLHPCKAIYWEEKSMLLMADLHLGKAIHFRKAGIPVPKAVGQENWDKFYALLLDFQPKKVLLLGDLFHSDYNNDWEDFKRLVQQFHSTQFVLVMGNHDILDNDLYAQAGLEVAHSIELKPFVFTHEPTHHEHCYNLAGHVHPSVRLTGNGKQQMRLPCFHFGQNIGLLPAFGSFTGNAIISPKVGDKVYVIANHSIVEVF